jgi:hypothetical protein
MDFLLKKTESVIFGFLSNQRVAMHPIDLRAGPWAR